MPTKLWDVRAALVDLFTEALDVPVYDGPVARTIPPKEFVLVGTDGGDTGTGEGVAEGSSWRQTWAGVGSRDRRQEEGEIICAAWAWSGSTDGSSLRLACKAITEQMEAALLSDRQLGGVLAPSGWAEGSSGFMKDWQRQEGAVCRSTVVVTYSARLNLT